MSTTATETVTFISKGKMFRAVRKPATRRITDFGVEPIAGIAYDFQPNGRFTTDDPDAIEYLESLPTFNREFWRLGSEPDRVPDPGPVLDEIMDAALELDATRLVEIAEAERQGPNREAVLRAAQSALRKVQGIDSPGEPVAEGAGSE